MRNKVFEVDNKQDLFLKISKLTKIKVNNLYSMMGNVRENSQAQDNLQFKINLEIAKWSEKMRKIGLTPIAIYKVKDGEYIYEL